MPVTTTQEIMRRAAALKQAAAAFNVVTLEQIEGVIAGAEAAEADVILQISENAVKFHGGAVRPLAAAALAAAEASSVPVSLHFDHVVDCDLIRQAASAGFSSVMVDQAHLPYAENVALTTRLAIELHDQGLHVEAELGEIGGKDGAHAPGVRTDPSEARTFAAATGVDALAVAVGSSHAMTARTAELDVHLIGVMREAVPVPLVLHGSSGVPPEQLRGAVAAGMTKINVGTLLGQAYTQAVRAYQAHHPTAVDPRTYLSPARDAVALAVETMLRDLALHGTAGCGRGSGCGSDDGLPQTAQKRDDVPSGAGMASTP